MSSNNFLIGSSKGAVATHFSVIIPTMNLGGVISNTGLIRPIPASAVFLSLIPDTSVPLLISII